MVGVNSRLQVFQLQRWINEYPDEALLAVLPGVALQELWQIVGVAETALVGVSAIVVITALMGMMAMILSSLNERRREMAIFSGRGGEALDDTRAAHARGGINGRCRRGPRIRAAVRRARRGAPLGGRAFGLWLPIEAPSAREGWVLLGVAAAAVLVSLLPALRAYRLSLADGMMVRI